MTLVVTPLPFIYTLQDKISCKTAFPVNRSQANNLYTQSYSNGLGKDKVYSLTYGNLFDSDESHTFANVTDIETSFSTQETNYVLSWCPPSESYKKTSIESGSITVELNSKTLVGNGTSFTSLLLGSYIFIPEIDSYRQAVFSGTGDIVTVKQHGLYDGDIIRFADIINTTGISTNFYYIHKLSENTFTLHTTYLDSVYNTGIVSLTTDGYGKFIEISRDVLVGRVASIESNTSLTLMEFPKTSKALREFKTVSPLYFYFPTKWSKSRKQTYASDTTLFKNTLSFTLTSLY
jgi:hypothetical protein